MRIAAVDDDPLQLELFAAALGAAGHQCHVFSTGTELLRVLRRETFDLLIVDWELPDASGPEIVAWVREHLGPELPILFVTHRQQERDIVAGLACGADDFMGKPVRVAELNARVAALLRRAWPAPPVEALDCGRYRFHPDTRTVEMDGRPVELKAREYELALFLFQNLGRLLSREHLREAVWGHNADVVSRSLDTHISRLRTQLQLRPDHGYVISSVYGVGYRLEAVPAQEGAEANHG